MRLVLASTSAIRKQMLDDAGVAVETVGATCDEEALKAAFEGAGEDLALHLARAKAVSVSREDAWTVGSDSVVLCNGRQFDKPRDRAEAAEHLRFFSGREMTLVSAVALARGDGVDWDHAEACRLFVRDLSDAFIEEYLEAEWPAVSYTVGVFRLEGPGVQLFEAIEGSHFAILGMPLLPLLGALRERGVLAS